MGALRAPAGDTVFIVPGSHLDLGFTAPISMVREQRISILDQAIKAASRDPGFVWFEEGGWTVEAWLDRYRKFWEANLDQFENYLDQLQDKEGKHDDQ